MAHGTAFVRRLTANLFFYSIQRPDPLQRFSRHRRRMRLLQIVELASDMRPTRGLLNAAIFLELIEACVGIGLQRATKLFQMLGGMFSFAIR